MVKIVILDITEVTYASYSSGSHPRWLVRDIDPSSHVIRAESWRDHSTYFSDSWRIFGESDIDFLRGEATPSVEIEPLLTDFASGDEISSNCIGVFLDQNDYRA
ncbi:hypothetical protein PIB30_057245 [Stylosanthes scabra]|uniref:Uncharacterized protein n=1 Tax=Stylosanthes scabra TaxID=79078 RepID=A0ABU6SLC9_9FABA|nr:hypothetical protein [Stylosanthes scabra]